MNDRIGSFKEIIGISRNYNNSNSEKQQIAKNLGALALQLQWVEGNAEKAEESFLKINQSATKISNAELELIENRNCAYAIAARAIARAGKGYRYWSKYDSDDRNEIVEISTKIHKIIFGEGPINKDDINTFPIGGHQSSNLTLDVVTQTVKICNGLKLLKDERQKTDATAKEVIKCLNNTLLILQYISSKETFSLGIHPFIYFYSDIGKHKIASYYGFLLLIKELITTKKLNKFTRVRKTFEKVIYTYKFLVQQIVRKNRQSKKAYSNIKDYFLELINIIDEHPKFTEKDVVNQIHKIYKFKFLKTEIIDNEEASIKSNFSRGTKQQIKLTSLIHTLNRCAICGGYLDNRSISVDHIVRKEDGGTNSKKNGQVTHLYCNTTYKN